MNNLRDQIRAAIADDPAFYVVGGEKSADRIATLAAQVVQATAGRGIDREKLLNYLETKRDRNRKYADDYNKRGLNELYAEAAAIGTESAVLFERVKAGDFDHPAQPAGDAAAVVASFNAFEKTFDFDAHPTTIEALRALREAITRLEESCKTK